MKKILILGSVTILGLTALFSINAISTYSSASAGTNDKVVLWGKVDFSDDEDDMDLKYSTKEESSDNNGGWLENFIKTHKTSFSKTIKK